MESWSRSLDLPGYDLHPARTRKPTCPRADLPQTISIRNIICCLGKPQLNGSAESGLPETCGESVPGVKLILSSYGLTAVQEVLHDV